MKYQLTRSGNPDLEREQLNRILRDIEGRLQRQETTVAQDLESVRVIVAGGGSSGGGGSAAPPSAAQLELSGDAVGRTRLNVAGTAQLVVQVQDAARLQGRSGEFYLDYDNLANRPVLGTAASAAIEEFATAEQGALAEQAVSQDQLFEQAVQVGLSRTFVAGESLHRSRLVRLHAGEVFSVDNTDPAHGAELLGITIHAVSSAGDEIDVQLTGVLEDDSWTWTEGYVYADVAGQLTQTPPTTGWLVEVGRAVSPTELFVSLEQPIYRS